VRRTCYDIEVSNGRGQTRWRVGAARRASAPPWLGQLFLLTTQTRDWFKEQGFVEYDRRSASPRKALYNYQRNSAVMSKALSRSV
jgi:N-acetylglutamate synthase-like GNAT family acetyltransferase